MNVHRADSRIFGIKGYVGKYPQIHLIGCFLKRGRFQTTAVCSPCRAIYSVDSNGAKQLVRLRRGLSHRGISCLVNGTATINRVPITIEKPGLIKSDRSSNLLEESSREEFGKERHKFRAVKEPISLQYGHLIPISSSMRRFSISISLSISRDFITLPRKISIRDWIQS